MIRTTARAACLALTASVMFAIPGATLLSSPASASPCNTSTFKEVKSGRTKVINRVNSEDSVYNKTKDKIREEITFGRSVSESVEKEWKVGASGSAGFGPVSASISAEYGERYTKGAETNRSRTRAYDIRPKHTGWVRAVFYQRGFTWKSYTYRYNTKRQRCVKRTIKKAFWGAPKVQYQFITRKGLVYPQ